MPYPGVIDFKNPDYRPVYEWRLERLRYMRNNPSMLPLLKQHYRDHPIDLIEDWGVTFDPRNANRGVPTLMPFCLFPRQREFLEFIEECLAEQRRGLSDKSRDMGLSWLLAAFACAKALGNDGFVFGFGSRKEDLVDKSGDPDTLFYKVRMFLSHLPYELRGGWVYQNRDCDTHLRIAIPETGGIIRGEAGKNIGRGGRSSMYAVDEAAFTEQPHLIENALSQNTQVRIDVSSVNGTDNPFAVHRHAGKVKVFTFRWQDDPRKDVDWYERQCRDLNPITVAQEIDLDYGASKEGVLIPTAWVNAALDAHIKLGIGLSGDRIAALDVADEGFDLNTFTSRIGVTLAMLESWSGKGSHIYNTTFRAMRLCDDLDLKSFYFDSDGLGVGVRGDNIAINALPERAEFQEISAEPFRGSASPVNAEAWYIPPKNGRPGIRNKDMFANYKAQAWWHLRTLFENTYKAVVDGIIVDYDEIISIPSTLPGRTRLMSELSQPLYSINTAGKLLVDKTPDGMKSPNDADSVMIAYAPREKKKTGFLTG